MGLTVVASLNPIMQEAFSDEKPTVEPTHDINSGELPDAGTGYTTTIEDKLSGMGLEHQETTPETEISVETQNELKKNTVLISGKDNKGNSVMGNALVVKITGEQGKPGQQLLLTSAHIFDFDKQGASKPIRDSLKYGEKADDIAPYLENTFVVHDMDGTRTKITRVVVDTDASIDTDLAVLRTEHEIAAPGVKINPDDASAFLDTPSDEVFINAIVNGETISETGINRISGIPLFSTDQKSDLVAVRSNICTPSSSGAAMAGHNGVEPGKVLYAEWDPANPAHSEQISAIVGWGMTIPPDYKVCQFIDGTSELPNLINLALT